MFVVNIYLFNHFTDLCLLISLFSFLLLRNHFLFLRLNLYFHLFLSLILDDGIKINLLFLIFKRVSTMLSFNNIIFNNFLLSFHAIILNQLSDLFILYLVLRFIYFITISMRIRQINMLYFLTLELLIILSLYIWVKSSWWWNFLKVELCYFII